MRWMRCLVIVIASCGSSQRYTYKERGEAKEERLPPVEARVVPVEQATGSGLAAQPLVVPFTGSRDGTELVATFFEKADAAKARMISDLAIYLETTQDGQPVECRTEIVPEAITESHWRPATTRLVSVQRPVTRMVSESEYRCSPHMVSEMRSHTEYEQKCGSVSKPVQRSRTTYSTEYDSMSHSSRSVPHTEYYTEYQSSYECKSEPVTRMRSEMVSKTECKYEPVTRSVTRYEFQLESQYVPARLESFTRQRLRELDPVCYVVAVPDEAGLAPPGRPGNRIEGKIYVGR